MKVGEWELPPLWDWQAKEDRLNGDKEKTGIFASPRLGKTNCVAGSLRRRALRGLVERGLVVAPLKVCPIWEKVLAGAGLSVVPVSEMSVKEIEAYFTRKTKLSWSGIAVINRDKLLETWKCFDNVDAFVGDESHNYAAVSSGRARAYRALARIPGVWTRALTGTPVPKHYGSLWGQLSPFDPARWNGESYGRFARRFLVQEAAMHNRVISHINVPELQSMVLALASVYRREDIWGKDKYQIVRRDVDMPRKAWDLYHRLAREAMLEEFNLEAANGGVKLLRLAQLTSGIISPVPGREEIIHTAKIDMLEEDLSEIFGSSEKAVIFHRFVPEGRLAVERIRKVYPNVPIWTVNGQERVSANEHYRRTEAFNNTEGAACIVVQMQSGSEGISLRKGNHLAYLSRTFSFTEDEHSRDRAYEPGELRTITYYEVPGTVDDFTADLLALRRTLHEAIKNIDRESLVYGPIRNRRKKI